VRTKKRNLRRETLKGNTGWAKDEKLCKLTKKDGVCITAEMVMGQGKEQKKKKKKSGGTWKSNTFRSITNGPKESTEKPSQPEAEK